MGWKNVKEHYRIGHFVRVRDGLICIGSPYIPDIIAIKPDGTIVKDRDYQNDDLRRYIAEMTANPAKLRELIETPDTFTESIPVYTEENGKIVEKLCECRGYPNVTHCGEFMYENTHFPTRELALRHAISDTKAGIKLLRRRVDELRKDLSEKKDMLAEDRANLAAFEDELRQLVAVQENC